MYNAILEVIESSGEGGRPSQSVEINAGNCPFCTFLNDLVVE